MEAWKTVPGYPAYSISDHGIIVRTLTFGSSPKRIWRRCAKRIKRGYVYAHLCKDGVVVDKQVHRLVWLTFNGQIPEHLEINHKNGERDDNRLCNLELMTKSQNCAHAFRSNGRIPANNPNYGSDNGAARLSEDNIPLIFALYDTGRYTQRQIAKQFEVTQRTICSVLRGENWGHISRPQLLVGIRYHRRSQKSP